MSNLKKAIVVAATCVAALSGYCAYLHFKIKDLYSRHYEAYKDLLHDRSRIGDIYEDVMFCKFMIEKAGIKHGRKED